eukprot:3248119-Pleurochrysis_carterae.AAC.1
MPSGREKGPEKRSNTRREVSAAACVAVGARWRGAGNAASQATCEGVLLGWEPGKVPFAEVDVRCNDDAIGREHPDVVGS